MAVEKHAFFHFQPKKVDGKNKKIRLMSGWAKKRPKNSGFNPYEAIFMTNAVSLNFKDAQSSSRLRNSHSPSVEPVSSIEPLDRIERPSSPHGVISRIPERRDLIASPIQNPLASGEVSLRRAHELLYEVERDNRNDLDRLFASLGPEWGEERFAAVDRIAHDQTRFNDILSRITQPDRDLRCKTDLGAGYYPFITGLKKLAGAQGEPGLLCEASAWLTASAPLSELRTRQIACHAVAVSKVALIYASGAQGQADRRVPPSRLTLCYPAEVPVEWETAFEPLLLTETSQSVSEKKSEKLANLTFFVPNSGFVFGGDMMGSVCRGLDCSALISYCIQSPLRFSTVHFEQVARASVDKGEPISGLLARVASGLEVVPNDSTHLRAGDIVVWRGDSGGHVAFFKAWSSQQEKKFFAIDASRWGVGEDSRDGLALSELSIFREDRRTYILRIRTTSSTSGLLERTKK